MNMETKDLETIINKWFEMKLKTYDKLEHDGSIYLYYNGEKHAEIRIEKKIESIYYKWEIYEEFYQIISLHYHEFEEFMGKWLDDTFKLGGIKSWRYRNGFEISLTIPKLNN